MGRAILRGSLGTAVAVAITLAALLTKASDWRIGVLVLLTGASVAADMTAIRAGKMYVTAAGAIVALAAVLLGPLGTVIVGLAPIVVNTVQERRSVDDALWNLVTFSWFPLLASTAVLLVEPHAHGVGGVILLVAIASVVGWLVSFAITALSEWVISRRSILVLYGDNLVPLITSEWAGIGLTAVCALSYLYLGTAGLTILIVTVLLFQRLTRDMLDLKEKKVDLEAANQRLEASNLRQVVHTIRLLAMRDPATARHSAAVAMYVRALSVHVGLEQEQISRNVLASVLHDIGKMAVPEAILNAARRLTADEFATIKTHPEEGAAIVGLIEGFDDIAEIILSHHEGWAGGGYPARVSGEGIPLCARMISLADAYDVMTARTIYREPRSHEEAIEELQRCAGTQFDPALVGPFVEMLDANPALRFGHTDESDFERELRLILRRGQAEETGDGVDTETEAAPAEAVEVSAAAVIDDAPVAAHPTGTGPNGDGSGANPVVVYSSSGNPPAAGPRGPRVA